MITFLWILATLVACVYIHFFLWPWMKNVWRRYQLKHRHARSIRKMAKRVGGEDGEKLNELADMLSNIKLDPNKDQKEEDDHE